MPWWDWYKLWTYSFERSPLEKARSNIDNLTGAGVTQPEAIPDLRGEAWGGGSKGQIRLRDSNDFIDLSTVTNRQSRYKEYERLRNVAEIEMAMTVIADEACVAPFTKIATLFDGFRTIRWLKERWDKDQSPFLVYCWDFDKQDYTLGWAYDPRIVKKSKTVRILLDDGSYFVVTEDHRILRSDSTWVHAGDLTYGDELMPFYRVEPNRVLNGLKEAQFPRIYTFNDGWKHERQFIDEWKTGYRSEHYSKVNETCRLLANGVSTPKVGSITGHQERLWRIWLEREGFTTKELRWLGKKEKVRRVIGVHKYKELNVYDLSVEKHKNFCTDTVVMHNCQRNDDGNVFKVICNDKDVKDELDFLLFNRKMLNLNRKAWQMVKRLCIFGDGFYELVTNPEKPSDGVLKMQELPPDSMYKIVTTRGRLVEYQQAKDGPDFEALNRIEVTRATETELQQSTAIRFAPKQILHIWVGDDRKTFFPYGQSLIEPARGPAHQLRLMEDAMVVYRLTRAPERRVFYIDCQGIPPFKAEAFIKRMKDQFRKKKVARGGQGANAVEERWHAPAADEDYWLPTRPNSNTRIETLPGAQNLGEIDDALYFRNKLFTALNFPRNYLNNEDPQATRISLSAQDAKFARMIERIQYHIIDGIIELCERHLELRGFPEESYKDLQVEMTVPSAWKELSEMEVVNQRLSIISGLKGSMLMSDFDLLTRYLRIPEEEVRDIIARNNIQKLQELKLQIIGQNPQIAGIGVPGQPSGEPEMGSEVGGPNPMLGPEGKQPEPGPGMESEPPMPPEEGPKKNTNPLEEPSDEDIKKYDLGMQGYSKHIDDEDIDWSMES